MDTAEQELEFAEWESQTEAAERAPIRRPSPLPSFKPRPVPGTPQPVTQAQLEAALTRVDGKIKTLSDGVGTLGSRVNSLVAATKKEAASRKSSIDAQGKDLNQKLQLLGLLPLLIQTPSVPIKGLALVDDNNNPINAIDVPDTSTLDAILPLLLVSGLGGSGGGALSLGGDGGGDSGLLLLALALTLGRRP